MRANLAVIVYETGVPRRHHEATEITVGSERITIHLDTPQGNDHQGEGSDPPEGEVLVLHRDHCSISVKANW